jgi:hypothetical protein
LWGKNISAAGMQVVGQTTFQLQAGRLCGEEHFSCRQAGCVVKNISTKGSVSDSSWWQFATLRWGASYVAQSIWKV